MNAQEALRGCARSFRTRCECSGGSAGSAATRNFPRSKQFFERPRDHDPVREALQEVCFLWPVFRRCEESALGGRAARWNWPHGDQKAID